VIPNIYMIEQCVHEHRQTLLHEAEPERGMAEAQPTPSPHRLHRLAARLGKYFVAVGTRLQGAQAVE
jgi:hypothetical protein